MAFKALIGIALFTANACAVMIMGPPAALFLLPIPIAISMARGQFGYAAAAFIGAVLSSIVGTVGLWLILNHVFGKNESLDVLINSIGLCVLFYVFVAVLSVLLGLGYYHHWTYGHIVAVLAVIVFGVVGVGTFFMLDTATGRMISMTGAIEHELEKKHEKEPDDIVAEQLQWLQWLKGNMTAIVFGFLFSVTLVMTCIGVSITTKILRVFFGEPGPTGSFMEMRPPPGLVWLVIVLAVMWYVDRYWPAPDLRVVAWNMAIGVGVIYWLNGLAIFLYGGHVLQPTLLPFVALVLVVLMLGFFYVFTAVGLFDTWGDFRMRLEGWAAALNNRNKGS